MIDGTHFSKICKIARDEMKRIGAKHSCYGLFYNDIEELAEDENEIKHFMSDQEFEAWVDEIRKKYAEYGIHSVMFYATHAR